MIAEIREDFPERQAVRKSIHKKLKGEKHRELDVKEKRRLAQHLMAKGFTPGIIFETIAGSEEEEIDADRQ
jgi:SOS response regulatory protein OraA/RecX